MTDRITKLQRSWNMSRIRSKNTKPEKTVGSLLHRMGFRYRLYRKDLPGKPDLVLNKYRTVVFVHGCFWHRHEGCKASRMPENNAEYWRNKFKRNLERDRYNENCLRKEGWNVVVVWQCELRDLNKLASELVKAIQNSMLT